MHGKKMKICFFSGYFPVCPGGAEYQAYLLSRALENELYDVFFISIGGSEPGKKVIDGVTVYFLSSPKLGKIFGKTFFLLYWQIKRILKIERPDIVYQRSGYSATGIVSILSKLLGFKFIWACANTSDLSNKSIFTVRIFDVVEECLKNYGIRNADKILVQSSDQKKSLLMDYSRNSEILKNAHPEPFEKPVLHSDKKIILFIGNFKKSKQPNIFLDLANEFIEFSDVEFIMIGRTSGDSYTNAIESRIRSMSNVRWLGEIPQGRVNEILCSAYLLVNTSLYEGFSNTFIQAWQRGVPVLSLNVDPDKLLSDGGMGKCSGSFRALQNDLRNLLNNQKLRNEMGESGINYAKNEHSLEAISKRFKIILTEVNNA